MLEMILATDKNGCIGKDGKLPWHIPSDLKHFRKTTTQKTIVMGYTTWISLGETPLPNRNNLILTRKKSGRNYLNSLDEIVALSESEHVIIIGGAQLYNELAQYVSKIYLTHVDTQVEGGDTFFDLSILKEFTKTKSQRETDCGYNLEFAEYVRL